jgi:hypothetical protein
MPGKTPMWGNPTRERDLLFSFRKVYYSSKLTISSQGKIPHSTNNMSQKKLPRFPCPQSVVWTILYGLEIANRTSKIAPKNASIFVPNPYDYTDLYSTASHNRKIFQPKTLKNFFLGICALLLLTFLSQAYSENLSNSTPLILSVCLAHYPMHSFII